MFTRHRWFHRSCLCLLGGLLIGVSLSARADDPPQSERDSVRFEWEPRLTERRLTVVLTTPPGHAVWPSCDSLLILAPWPGAMASLEQSPEPFFSRVERRFLHDFRRWLTADGDADARLIHLLNECRFQAERLQQTDPAALCERLLAQALSAELEIAPGPACRVLAARGEALPTLTPEQRAQQAAWRATLVATGALTTAQPQFMTGVNALVEQGYTAGGFQSPAKQLRGPRRPPVDAAMSTARFPGGAPLSPPIKL